MTDQIPADKVEKIAADMRAAMRREDDTYRDAQFLDDMSGYIRDLDKLCARARPRPLPTLADMTPEERSACKWMQADTKLWGRVVIIVPDLSDGRTALLERSGDVIYVRYINVTPRPDLPRMTWPGTEKPAPAPALPEGWRLADHPEHGRVIVANAIPGRDGHIHYVFSSDRYPTGLDWHHCTPDELTYIDGPTTKGAGTTTGPNDVAVGTVIESADDPRIAALPVGSILLDRNEEATTKRHWGWSGAGFSPIVYERDRFAPWTVLHIPKEADQ